MARLRSSAGVLARPAMVSYTSSADAWKGVVVDGNLQSIGMVSFADVCREEEDVEAIRAYVVQQAHNPDGMMMHRQRWRRHA